MRSSVILGQVQCLSALAAHAHRLVQKTKRPAQKSMQIYRIRPPVVVCVLALEADFFGKHFLGCNDLTCHLRQFGRNFVWKWNQWYEVGYFPQFNRGQSKATLFQIAGTAAGLCALVELSACICDDRLGMHKVQQHARPEKTGLEQFRSVAFPRFAGRKPNRSSKRSDRPYSANPGWPVAGSEAFPAMSCDDRCNGTVKTNDDRNRKGCEKRALDNFHGIPCQKEILS
jgi:hypothetical protein